MPDLVSWQSTQSRLRRAHAGAEANERHGGHQGAAGGGWRRGRVDGHQVRN
jgi:hypothetical protein